MDYSYTKKEIAKLMKRLFSDKETRVSPENRKHIEEHVAFLHSSGKNERTVLKHLYCLRKILEATAKEKLQNLDLAKATRQDLQRIIAHIETSEMASETKRNVKSITKAFYKHMLGEDLYYPQPVLWIKTSSAISKRTLPEDILTESDVQRLLEKANNFRDKAIVSLLFDSGIRVGELLTLRIKDVDLNSEPAHRSKRKNRYAKDTDYVQPAVSSSIHKRTSR